MYQVGVSLYHSLENVDRTRLFISSLHQYGALHRARQQDIVVIFILFLVNPQNIFGTFLKKNCIFLTFLIYVNEGRGTTPYYIYARVYIIQNSHNIVSSEPKHSYGQAVT